MISRSIQAWPGNSQYLIKLGLLFLLIAFKSCELDQVVNTTPERQTLLLVSLDGFANYYFSTSHTPVLDSLMQAGASGVLIPVFPTKTFPNHYTQVTGLYPENHGIISNLMYDQQFNQYFTIGSFSKTTADGRWYQGEPIWATCEKQGLFSATMFWPGSDAEIGGVRPRYYFPFNGSVTPEQRIDQVLQWLASGQDRPDLVTLYFEQIDQAGHRYGPYHKAVTEVIADVDTMLGVLMRGIQSLKLTYHINIILVSDHGMGQLDRDRVIFLDDYLALDQFQVLNWTPVLEIIPKHIDKEVIIEKLTNAHPQLQVYLKQDTPEHWRFQNHHRITPILGLASPGWSISTRDYFTQHPRSFTGGAHGYDTTVESMHGIFVAAGPGFRVGANIGSIESVHLYELLCNILELKPNKNDGELEVWRPILN